MKYIVCLTTLLLPVMVEAKLILNCTEEGSTSVAWNENPGFFEEKGMKYESGKTKKPISITIVQDGKEAYLKGNNGQGELTVIDSETFFEQTGLGGLVMYKYMRTPAGVPYVISLKAYELNGPTTYTTVFKCK